MNVSPQQIQAAAAAGVQLLSNKELPVPLGIAIGGQLSVLSSMLSAIASGEVILTSPPTPDQAAAGQKTPEEETPKPTLESVGGGKPGAPEEAN